MAKEAFLENGDHVEIRNQEIVMDDGTVVSGPKKYFCVTCGAEMTLASEHSNYKRPYFRGTHVPGMGCGKTHPSKGITDYNTSEEDIDRIFKQICRQRENHKTEGEAIIHNRNRLGHKAEHLDIHTARQLYQALKNSGIHDLLYKGADTEVWNLLCDDRDSFIYTKYISGRHVVETDYLTSEREDLTIDFAYPSTENQRLTLTAYFMNVDVYNRVVDYIFREGKKSFILFADFDGLTCTIYNEDQILRR